MSYDLHLLRVPVGIDPLAYMHEHLEDDAEQSATPSQIAESLTLRLQLADSLCKHDPSLSQSVFNYRALGTDDGTEDDAGPRYRCIELNGREDGPGIQISLYYAYASVTVPYWHDGEDADSVWRTIWGYLELLASQSGFCVYDSQHDKILDLTHDRSLLLRTYVDLVKGVQRSLVAEDVPKRRPWWKLW